MHTTLCTGAVCLAFCSRDRNADIPFSSESSSLASAAVRAAAALIVDDGDELRDFDDAGEGLEAVWVCRCVGGGPRRSRAEARYSCYGQEQ